MLRSILKITVLFFFFLMSSYTFLKAEIVSKIIIEGNDRISPETIKMFSGVSENDDLSESDLNSILKNLYDSNFFELVTIKLENNILLINIKENPIIQNIYYEGIKSDDLLSDLKKYKMIKVKDINEIIKINGEIKNKVEKLLKINYV